MKGDFSRVSFAERKHYQEVLLQQGRVQLDADWNEAEAIRATRDQRALQDVVGRCGSPNTGFQIAARMMLDSMESTAHWAGTNADVCVDYVDYLRGTASLRVTGTTQIAKTLADPVDFTNASISFAVKVPLAHPQDADTFTFFVSDLPNAGGNAATVAVGLLTPQKVGPWRVYTIPLTPAVYQKVDLTRIQTIGFKDLVATRIYHFDSIQRDFAPPSVPLKDILALDDLEDLSGWSVPPSSGTGSVSLDGATLFNGHPTVKITGPGDGLRSFAHARDLTLYKRFVVVASTTPTPTFFLQPSSGPRIVRTPASATTAGDWTTYLFEPGADLATITGLATITAYGIENVAAGHAVNVAQVLGVLDLSGNFFILGGDDDYPGRLYVDGIACQKEATETYYSQRDYPEALALGLTAPADDGRVDLVYVDVCQRHVTYIEDPQLREVALAGPDTCTRNQTVAQVKVLRGVSDETTNRLNCAAIPSGLATTYAQLAGRGVGTMSTLVSPPTQPTSLCEIAPDADYLGLDNRLYRVEIHDPGVVDTATFKWSKDNGAIAVAVVEDVPAAQATQVLKVERLGRDRATTIAKGDLVEIADDLTDLSDSSYDTDGVPRRRVGELRKVTDVDPDANAITLDGPLSNGYKRLRRRC